MFRQQVQASISVFLALTITLVLSFCMVLIESARENTLLLKADIVMDAGVQSVLAEYNIPLWEKYDLLYVDCSYNTESPDYEKVKGHLTKFIDRNLELWNQGWLGLDYQGTEMVNVLLATDVKGEDFYRQAVRSAEAWVGISYIQQIAQWFERLETTYSTGEMLQEEISDTSFAIEDANGMKIEVKEAVWGSDEKGNPIILQEAEYEIVDIENPLDQILSANMLVRQIMEDYSEVSGKNISLENLASHRDLAVGTVEAQGEADSIWNKILFGKYVLNHFSCYGNNTAKKSAGLQYEVEYIIGGRAGDKQNMEIVVAELLLIREIDNYLVLLQDEMRKLEAHEMAIALTATLVPWLEPIMYHAILLYWAYEDSVEDLRALFQGRKIPLVKSLPVDVIGEFTLGYEEYLLLLLLMQKQENLAMRSIDVIEMTLREENNHFRMDACIAQAQLTGLFLDMYDKKYIVAKKLQYY